MGFFDDSPVPAGPRYRPRRWPHPWGPPEAEFPGIVPVKTLQFQRSEQAAIAVTAIVAYTAGCEIFMHHRIRPGALGIAGDRMPDPSPAGVPAALRSLHFGLQFSDGSRVISSRLYVGPGPDSGSAGPILRPIGGDTQFSWWWWAWPLPPGPVRPEANSRCDVSSPSPGLARSAPPLPGNPGCRARRTRPSRG